MVNGYNFRESNSVIFIFASHPFCSIWIKFYPLRVNLVCKGYISFGSKHKVTKVVPSSKNAKKS